jgi:3-phosphoshikimate 1-carboxyvinyltransferase
MEAVITGSKIKDGSYFAPPSKSYTHRAFAIASLADGDSLVKNPLRAGDTESTLSACRAFGVEVREEGKNLLIKGTAGKLKTPAHDIDVGNSGTTIRFFTSIAALNDRVVLKGDESILRRPMQPLIESLAHLGAAVKSISGNGRPPVMVSGGGIDGGTARIRGSSPRF